MEGKFVWDTEASRYSSGSFDEIMKEAKTAILQHGATVCIYELRFIGTVEPVSEPVIWKPVVDIPARPFRSELTPPQPPRQEEPKLHPRPRGKAPVGKEWDAVKGEWVDSKPSAQPPSAPPEAKTVDNPNVQVQTREEAKVVVGDHDPFADLADDKKLPSDTSDHAYMMIDGHKTFIRCPGCGNMKAGGFNQDWTCKECGMKHPDADKSSMQPKGDPNLAARTQQHNQPAAEVDLAASRCGDDDEKCLRCGADAIGALVNDKKIKVCSAGCPVSPETAKTYDTLYGPVSTGEMTVISQSGITVIEESFLPEEEAIEQTAVFLGMALDLPPKRWEEQELESDPDLMKALNTALSESGYGGDLRHPACVAILGQVRELKSLKELNRAEGKICRDWLSYAGPDHLAQLAKLVKAGKVSV